MAYPSSLDFLRIPSEVLIGLDNRPFHFALQPFHHLVRMTHILSVSAFFGGVFLLDLRLIGVRPQMPLPSLSNLVLPWLYGLFGAAMLSGLALFFYDPVHVGAHAYFTLKLLFIVLALANALVFRQVSHAPAVMTGPGQTGTARAAGTLSLVFWLGVMICACLNVEAAPRVLLQ